MCPKTFATFVVALVCMRSAGAEEEKTGLKLHLSLAADEIKQFAPLVAKIRIENTSAENRTVYSNPRPEFGNLTYRIPGPGGRQRRLEPVSMAAVPKHQQKVLAAGEGLEHHQWILWSGGAFHFDQPGAYSIQASSRFNELDSNIVKFRVSPAEGVDQKALEHWRGNPQALFALGATSDYTIAQEFEAILRDYPESVYTPWCYYFLGEAWQRRAESDELGRLRKTGIEYFSQKALALYEELLKKEPDFPRKVEISYEMAKERLRFGEREKAFAEIDRLTEKHPALYILQQAEDAVERMQIYENRAGNKITDAAFAANLPDS